MAFARMGAWVWVVWQLSSVRTLSELLHLVIIAWACTSHQSLSGPVIVTTRTQRRQWHSEVRLCLLSWVSSHILVFSTLPGASPSWRSQMLPPRVTK